MLIKLTDLNKVISTDAIALSDEDSAWNSDWLHMLFEFPEEQYDEEGALCLTQAEYNDYKLSAQAYINAVSADGSGIMLVEEDYQQ